MKAIIEDNRYGTETVEQVAEFSGISEQMTLPKKIILLGFNFYHFTIDGVT